MQTIKNEIELLMCNGCNWHVERQSVTVGVKLKIDPIFINLPRIVGNNWAL